MASSSLKGLSAEAINIAICKPPYWEYLLFFHCLIGEVNSYESLRQARNDGFLPGATEQLSVIATASWISDIFDKSLVFANHAEELMNEYLSDALGKSGQAGSTEKIVLVARKMGLVYKQFLEISIRCNQAEKSSIFDGVFRELIFANDKICQEFEKYPQRALSTILNDISTHDGKTKKTKELSMKLTFDPKPFISELDKVKLELFGKSF